MNRRSRLPLAIHRFTYSCLVILLATVAQQARGDALVDCSLKGISKVRIMVLTGGFRYEPIPGLDLQELEVKVHRAVADTLAESEIDAVDESEQILLINFNKVKTEGESYVIITRVRLREPAIINRSRQEMNRSEIITSWESWQFEQVGPGDSMKTILGSVRTTVHDFGQVVARAAQEDACTSSLPLAKAGCKATSGMDFTRLCKNKKRSSKRQHCHYLSAKQ
jgi:hypothetical protein